MAKLTLFSVPPIAMITKMQLLLPKCLRR